jgi:hypothetical protein
VIAARRHGRGAALALALAALAWPAAAPARPVPLDPQALSDYYGWGETIPAPPRDLRSPDGADAARSGEIAKEMQRYEAASTGDAPAWPEIAFAGVVLLTAAGGVARVRLRRRRRVAV